MVDQPAPTSSSPALPVLTPGYQTSEFYLLLAVVAAIIGAIFYGKLDPVIGCSILGALGTYYPGLRTWIKSQHLDTVVEVLTATHSSAKAANMAAAVQAIFSGTSAAPTALAESPAPLPVPAKPVPEKPPGTGAGVGPAILLLIGSLLAASLLTGCSTAQNFPPGSYLEGDAGYSKDTGPTISGTIHIPLGRGYAK